MSNLQTGMESPIPDAPPRERYRVVFYGWRARDDVVIDCLARDPTDAILIAERERRRTHGDQPNPIGGVRVERTEETP